MKRAIDTVDVFLEAGMENIWRKTRDLVHYLSYLLNTLEGVKVINLTSEYSGHVSFRLENDKVSLE